LCLTLWYLSTISSTHFANYYSVGWHYGQALLHVEVYSEQFAKAGNLAGKQIDDEETNVSIIVDACDELLIQVPACAAADRRRAIEKLYLL